MRQRMLGKEVLQLTCRPVQGDHRLTVAGWQGLQKHVMEPCTTVILVGEAVDSLGQVDGDNMVAQAPEALTLLDEAGTSATGTCPRGSSRSSLMNGYG